MSSDERGEMMQRCGLCQREVAETTDHHLIPRTRHKNKRNKKSFSREEVRTRLVPLCRPCHRFIHATFDEKDLERELNTIEALLAHPDVKRFVTWIANKPDGFSLPSAQSSRTDRRRRRP